MRIKEFDYLRAFCAFSVIVIHVTAGYIDQESTAYVFNQIARYAVPLFILLSGFGLGFSERKKNTTYFEFLKKRYNKILLPYFLWSIIYFVFSNRHQIGSTDADVTKLFSLFIKQLYSGTSGTAYVHLYFLVIMIQLYLVFPVLQKWLVEKRYHTLVGSFFISLCMHAAIYLHAVGIIVLPSLGVPYVILSPVWVFYFVLGIYISMEMERFIRVTEKITFAQITFVWLLTFMLLHLDSKYTNTFASSAKPSTILYTLSSLVFLFKGLGYVAYARPKMSALFLWYSTHSFFIYLIHPLIISWLVLAFPYNWRGTIGLLEIFISTMLLSTLLTYIGSKFKRIHIVGGVYTGNVARLKSGEIKSGNHEALRL